MTVAVGTPIRRYDGNDVAESFPFGEIIYEETDLIVIHRANGVDNILLLDTDYTVDGVPASGIGTTTATVEFPKIGSTFGTLATGEILSAKRLIPQERVADLVAAYFFDPMNIDMDKFVVMIQDAYFWASRAAILTDPNSDAPISLEALMASLGDGSHSSLDDLSWLTSGHLDSFSGYTLSAAAPGSTPVRVGQMWIRSTNQAVYMSIGTSSPNDWKLLNVKTFGFIEGDGVNVITAGKKDVYTELPHKGTIIRVTTASTEGGVKVARLLDAQLLMNGANISASDPLSLNGTDEENKTSFSGWTTDFNAYDNPQLEILVSPVPTATRITVTAHYIEK